MKNLWKNPSVKTTSVILGIIISIITIWKFVTQEDNTHSQVITDSPGSINTIGQTGGINTINSITASSTTSAPTFKVVMDSNFSLPSGKYEYDYNFIPITKQDNPILFELDVDKETRVESMILMGDGKTFGKHSDPLFVSGDDNENVNHWVQSYLSIPPINLKLKILFDQKPKIYEMQTSALGGH